MANKAAITKFNNKLEALEKETGFAYKMEIQGYEDLVGDNKLDASWFEPGTVLARVEGEKVNLIFEIAGGLIARLKDNNGATVKEFNGFIEPFNDSNVAIENDKDIEALVNEKHESGYTLEFEEDNYVTIYAEDLALEPIKLEDVSIARCILNKEISEGFMKRAIEELDSEKSEKYSAALDAALDELTASDAEGNDGIELPELPSVPNEAEKEPEKNDIPTYEEFAKTPEGKAEIKAQKEEKEKAKKASKATKKTSKTAKSAGSGAIEPMEERYDLLPLDFVGDFMAKFDEEGEEKSFFAAIEDYKNCKGSLLDATVMFAKANFAEAVDAVADLAITAGYEAAKAGEDDAWKEGDIKDGINKAVKAYLEGTRKEPASGGYVSEALWGLFTGAWMSENA